MIGSLIGDAAGSIYEGHNKHPSRINFKLFPYNACYTDDTVLLLATCDAILNSKPYGECYKKYYEKYPFVGYGRAFKQWANSDSIEGYGSYGNGSAMRSAPIAWAFETKEEVLEEAKKSAECTHNSLEGIKGAQAIAYATFLARKGSTKKEIRTAMEEEIGYNLLELKKGFDNSCQGSCPNAIVAFLNSGSFVETIRAAVLMGGDSDTIACMAGGIGQAYYELSGIPPSLIKKLFKKLPDELAEVVVEFTNKYIDRNFKRPSRMSKSAEMYDLYRSILKSK